MKITDENYTAIIAKITATVEIPNADKIQMAKVMGESVVVSKDWKEGMVGVFFPADSQLSEDYCHYNNLNRDSSKNVDSEKKGFFDTNRKVRCQPFLKVRSEAFFAELESLSWASDITKLKLGDKFNELNGKHICKKYISEVTLRKMNNKVSSNKKKTSIKEAPMFNQHVNTGQFKYNSHVIEKGDLVSFHAKVHGCFPSNQTIKMWDGTKKRITSVKTGDYVVGYKEGKYVKSKVTNTFYNGKTDLWHKLYYTNKGYNGDTNQHIACTGNHEIYTINRGYINAENVSVGDLVSYSSKSPLLSKQQTGAFLGMMLGDGYLSNAGNLQMVHKKSHREYLEYKMSLFSELGDRSGKYQDKVSGYGSETVFNMLPVNSYIKETFKQYQEKGVGKVLDDNVLDLVTEETLAFLYLDDGSLTHNVSQKDRASIAICGIGDEYVDIVVKMFNKFAIYPVYFKDINGYNRLRFNHKDAYKLFDIVKNYTPECVKYKLPEEYRVDCLASDIERSTTGFVECVQEITKTETTKPNKRFSSNKYDLETETSNYVAGNILVHNSSARYSYSKVLRTPETFKDKVLAFFGKFNRESWEYLVGTRRVVLYEDQYNREGFHGSEQYRFDVLEKLKPFMEKGMTIYGEIAGYANGKPIMGKHSTDSLKDKKFKKKYGKDMIYKYGCPEGEQRFHIYRITYVNESGKELDFTAKQIEEWCTNNGFLSHLNVHEPILFDGDYEALNKLVEDLTEREEVLCEDYLDPSHVSEGIIVRVDKGSTTPVFLKSKSYAFKVMEGIFKESNVDEEDAS